MTNRPLRKLKVVSLDNFEKHLNYLEGKIDAACDLPEKERYYKMRELAGRVSNVCVTMNKLNGKGDYFDWYNNCDRVIDLSIKGINLSERCRHYIPIVNPYEERGVIIPNSYEIVLETHVLQASE